MRVLLAFILFLVPAFSAADEDRAMKLTVKPMLCITDERTPVCDMSFLVFWQSNESGYYCLFNDFGEAPLRCWQEERTGELNDERSVQTDFSYWITASGEEARLAAVKVEVLRMDTDDRRRKRRTRHVWDLL